MTVLQEIDGKGKGRLLTFMYGAGLIEANNPAITLVGADLRGAYLRDANLRDANLRDANLDGVPLQGAILRGADLSDATLRAADLHRVRGVDNQKLYRVAGPLEDSIMPNGQKYEDWLKSK